MKMVQTRSNKRLQVPGMLVEINPLNDVFLAYSGRIPFLMNVSSSRDENL